MVIMALDHTRDFFHADAQLFQPTDLTRTNAPLFFTRWITHFCAPTFVLLSGMAIRLRLAAVSRADMKRYLLSRGLWLIVLELTIFRFIFFFNFYYDITFLTVLWMIGANMMIMAAVIYLRENTILILALLIIFGHNLTDGLAVPADSVFNAPWVLLMKIGLIPPFMSSYPLIPWLGLMMLGFWLGRFYHGNSQPQRRRILITAGASMVLLFVVIRLINIYGDPAPWLPMETPTLTFMSFLNATKYPPSLVFVLMTIGPVLILLGLIDPAGGKPGGVFLTIGREPLLYFLIHFLIIHASALAWYMIDSGKSWQEIDTHIAAGLGGLPPGSGIGLPGTYVAWITVVAISYAVCRWYTQYKRTHSNVVTRWI